MTEKIVAKDRRKRLGEIVEASSTIVTTQCYDLYEAPPLGSLISSGQDNAAYGIVCEVTTQSIDPSRRIITRGQDEDTEEQVYLNNPQLTRLLLTEFKALLVGHEINHLIHRSLPPLPPRIHSFVYHCDNEETKLFSSSLEFLPLLLSTHTEAIDDVITAFINQASQHHDDPMEFLVYAGKELAILFNGQLQRLNNALRRLVP